MAEDLSQPPAELQHIRGIYISIGVEVDGSLVFWLAELAAEGTMEASEIGFIHVAVAIAVAKEPVEAQRVPGRHFQTGRVADAITMNQQSIGPIGQ
jgi:hypothetical protein